MVTSTTTTKTPSGAVSRTTKTEVREARINEVNKKKIRVIKAKQNASQNAMKLANGNPWVQNLIFPQRPTQLPRLIPSRTCPKYHTFDMEVSTPAGQYGAAIAYPGYHDSFEFYKPIDAFSGQVFADQLATAHSFNSNSHPKLSLDLDIKILTAEGNQHTIPSKYADFSSMVVKKDGTFSNGKIAYYPGTYNFTDVVEAFAGLYMFNEDNADMDITAQIGSYNLVTQAVDYVYQYNSSIGGNSGQELPSIPSSSATFQNLTIMITITNPQIVGSVPSGMKFSLESGQTNPLVYSGSGVWVKFGLTNDILGSRSLTEQIEFSNSISIAACSAMATNTSSNLYKGGYIVAAQIPSGAYANLPREPVDLFNYISKQVRGPKYAGDGVYGCFASYTPDKLEEVFFIDTQLEREAVNLNKRLRPCIVFVWRAPLEGGNTFNFNYNLATEIISDDISMEYILGPADTENMLAYLLYLKQRDNHFCENPEHWDRIKEWTKKIVNDPRFRKVASSCVKAGSTALLSLL